MIRSRPTTGICRGAGLAALVAVGGIALSLVTGGLVTGASRQAGDQILDRRAQLIQDAASSEAARYEGAVRLLADGMGSYADPTAAKFYRLTRGMGDLRLAGATSIAFIAAPVDDAGVASLQAEWRARGSAGLRLAPVGHGQHLFAVLSRALDGRTTRAAGIDAGQAAAPRTALLAAAATGRVQVSDAYQLIVDRALPAAQRQQSFVVTAPVWTPDDGPRRLRGWVLLGVRGQDFVRDAVTRAAQGLADVTLQARGVDGRPVTVATMTTDGAGRPDQQRTVTVPVAQSRWTIQVSAQRSRMSPAGASTGTVIAWGGSAISVLLALLVLSLVTARTRADQRVVQATAASVEAAEEARRQAGLLAAVLESISEAVGVVDGDGAFIVHNRAAKELLGVADVDADGRPVIEPDRPGAGTWQEHYGIFRPDGTTPFPTGELPLVRALDGESTNEVEMVIRNPGRPDGVLIAVSGRPLQESAGQAGAVAVFRDVTAQRAHEAELAAFAAVAAHDLKTPLAVVAGYAELVGDGVVPELRRHGADAAADLAEQQLGTILTRARGGAALVEHLLRFASARDARLDVEDVDLTALAEEVAEQQRERLATLAATGGAGVPARFTIAPAPPVRGDRGLLRQVLDNLVGNAVKYTAPGEPVVVDVVGHRRADGLVEVSVRDRGIGIPAGQHGQVFGAFRRAQGQAASASVAGAGLGLAICRRVVERHGGTIMARDHPGGGTQVVFTLPAAPPGGPGDPALLAAAGAVAP